MEARKGRLKQFLLATVTSFLFLVVINALLFPVFFPDGPPEMYENRRLVPLYGYHLLAFLVTAFMMSLLYPMVYRGGPAWREGLKTGIVVGLFVSLPENLHVYAQVDMPFIAGLAPALWVTVIWGLAGIVIGYVYHFRSSDTGS